MSEAVAIQSAKNRRKPQQRAIDTRAKIIAAAIDEFATFGFEGASTRRIAEASGVKHALVTYHFKSKDGLFRAVVMDINQLRRVQTQARLEGLRGVDETTQLRLMLEDFIRFAADSPQFHWIMTHVASERGERLQWVVETFLKPGFAELARLIRRSQEEGRFVEGDPIHLIYLFVGAVTRIFMLAPEVEMIMGRSPFDPAFVEEHAKACIGLFFRQPAAKAGYAGRA
jgi:AcrR family transcriptional regulator